jgi:hypothetical protein
MIALALILAQSVTGPAGPTATPRAATSWSCELTDAVGAKLMLAGSFPEVPAGADPNRGIPVRLSGNGPEPLLAFGRFTAGKQSDFFRSYQVSARARTTDDTYHLNLELRRGGRGFANITHYAPSTPPEPFTYVAAGLCTSEFEPARKAG